jgi:hypothetical protein
MNRSFWLVVAAVLSSAPGCTTTLAARTRETSLALPPAVRSLASNGDPLNVRVYPAITPARSEAWVNVRVEPDDRSLSLVIAWLSDDGTGGSHLITLEGANAAVRHQYPLRGLDAGEYEVTAQLTRRDGTTVLRTARLIVTGVR